MAAAARMSRVASAALNGARAITIDAKAVRYARNGHPTAVLKVESVKLDTASVKPSDVLVRMLAAPITPVDLAQVAGSAALPSSAPAGASRVGGNEGLGIVEEAGASSGLKKGDLVVAARGGVGTWATHVIAPGEAWAAVAGVDVSKTDIEPLAAAVAPVLAAKRMLEGFVKLNKGDVVVQNNGASTVAQAVVQLAAAKGVRTVTLVRPGTGPEWDQLVPHLTSLGATLVASEEEAGRHEFAKTLKDLPAGVLGLNSSGGAAATLVARSLAQGATLVTYGTAGRRPAITVPLDLFTARDLTLRGFNLDAAVKAGARAARDAEVAGAVKAVADGSVKLLVAREPFKDFAAALERTYRPSNQRKVVLTF